MTSVPTAEEAELEIIDQMNRIRNASRVHVAQFHHEVERLKDWREHVRAQPILAVVASAVVGYIVVSKFTRPRERVPNGFAPSSSAPIPQPAAVNAKREANERSTASEVATKNTLSAGAMAFVGSLASSALRMAATHYLKSALDKRLHH